MQEMLPRHGAAHGSIRGKTKLIIALHSAMHVRCLERKRLQQLLIHCYSTHPLCKRRDKNSFYQDKTYSWKTLLIFCVLSKVS